MIKINGSIGGGSVVRTAAGLAVATGKEISIDNIRQQRPSPGLKHQHVAGLKALAHLCHGNLEGNWVGSRNLKFRPGDRFRGSAQLKIETAGSIGLALQPLLIASLAADNGFKVEINGGATAGKWAPPLIYLQKVFYPLLHQLGIKIDLKTEKRGYYPQGGAKAQLKVERGEAKELSLTEMGDRLKMEITSLASTHLKENQVAERQATAARNKLKEIGIADEIVSKEEYVTARSPGSCLLVAAKFTGGVFGGDALGEKGKRAEKVGWEGVQNLTRDIKTEATLDEHSSDQIIPFLGIKGGEFTYPRLTDHIRTNLEVTNHFLSTKLSLNKKRKRIRG